MREVRHEENDGSSRHISLVGKPCAVVRKGETVKITIQGADLKTPIQITDRKVLANIQGWSGLGTSSAEAGFNPKAPGFIVDWSQGLTDEPPNYHAMRFRSTLTCPANGSYTLCHMPLTPPGARLRVPARPERQGLLPQCGYDSSRSRETGSIRGLSGTVLRNT